MKPQIIPQKVVLRNWEQMKQALNSAQNGDTLMVNVYFNRNLLLQAADRRCLNISVLVDPRA